MVHVLSYSLRRCGLNLASFSDTCLADRLSPAPLLYAQMTNEEQDYVIQELKRGI